MKNILLLSNKVFHYRVPIYNYFREEFLKEGYDFKVLTNELQKNFDHQFELECFVESPNFSKYKAIIRKINPSAVIVFMHLKDWIMWPMLHWLKLQGIPIIYWNHGVNLHTPNHALKNALYHYLHNQADAIVLYSPAEKKHIRPKNHSKVFIGYNTLNFRSFPDIPESKEELRKELNVPYQKMALFAASTTFLRRLELLIDVFKDLPDQRIGLILAGLRKLPPEYQSVVENSPAITYIGEIPDQVQFNKYVKLADAFTIPGRSGLAINQALYWGTPYVTMNVRHAPEIYYLKDGENGFIADVDTPNDFKNKLLKVLNDDELQQRMSKRAKEIIMEEGDIPQMFKGFSDAVQYAIRKKAVLKS
jgi:glycosyltransferase involved in cell wall biosynthesis